MKNVLFVDCCIRREASNTKKLAEAFLSALPSDCAVTRLDLMAENLSYFKDSYFDQREALLAENRRDHPRFRYAHQFAQADLIVIAAPFWDLSFPALLKVYIEQVSVDGITFGSTEEGLKGLCRASHMIFSLRAAASIPETPWRWAAGIWRRFTRSSASEHIPASPQTA